MRLASSSSIISEKTSPFTGTRRKIDRFGKSKAVDGFRFNSVRELATQRLALRDELENFAKARHHQVEAWEDFHIPSVLDAAFATIEAVTTTTNQVLAAAGHGLVRLGALLTEPLRDKHGEESEHTRI